MEYFGEEPAAEITNKKGGDLLHSSFLPGREDEYKAELLELGLDDYLISLLMALRKEEAQ